MYEEDGGDPTKIEVNDRNGEPAQNLAEAFFHFKKLLKIPQNNLTKVRSIAVSDLTWCRSDGHHHCTCLRHLKENITDGFQALDEILILYSEVTTGMGFRHYPDCVGRPVNFDTAIVQDEVRKALTQFFAEERLIRPACRVPRITFLSTEDENAPQIIAPREPDW